MTPPSLSRQPPTTVARPKASVRVLLELRQNPERLEKEAKAVVNVSKGHRRRRELISLQFDAANSKALVLLRAWQKCMAPGSALSYAMTLAGMHPYIRTDPQVRVVLDAMRQSASLGASQRAMLITPEWVRALLATASSTVAATAWFMWLSTCRHADLQYIHQFGTAPGYLVVRWDRFKSDRYGRRAVSRFITVLKSQEKFVKDLPRWCTYRQLLDALKKVNPKLSTYSLRRGGASFLADAGNSMPMVGLMTAHTPTADPALAVRRYVDPSASQPEAKDQLRMSRQLAMALEPGWKPPQGAMPTANVTWRR